MRNIKLKRDEKEKKNTKKRVEKRTKETESVKKVVQIPIRLTGMFEIQRARRRNKGQNEMEERLKNKL